MKAEWEELAAEGSQAAIQTAALIPPAIRGRNKDLGSILLATDGRWLVPDPETIRLSGGVSEGVFVHERLESDPETLKALDELGIKPATPETRFKDLASILLGRQSASWPETQWREFWQLASTIDRSASADIIRAQQHWRDAIRFRTIAGTWRSLFHVLLPGRIVPDDGSRDGNVAIDTTFHDQSRVPGSGVRGRGSGERETTASSLAGKHEAREKEDNGGQGKDGPAGAIAQGGNGR